MRSQALPDTEDRRHGGPEVALNRPEAPAPSSQPPLPTGRLWASGQKPFPWPQGSDTIPIVLRPAVQFNPFYPASPLPASWICSARVPPDKSLFVRSQEWPMETNDMPEICRFFGIIIAMYHKEHMPPHFHVKYAGYRASFSIQDLKIIEGELPRRAVSLVLEWAFQHRDDLMGNWERAQRMEALAHIEPLE